MSVNGFRLFSLLMICAASIYWPQQSLAAVYEGWAVSCRNDACFAESTVLASDRTWLMTVRARATHPGAEVQVIVPAGVHIASGLFVGVPGGTVKQAQFVRCEARACEAQLKLSEAELLGWKRGRAAQVRYRPRVAVRPVAFELSLSGITAAIQDLEEKQ
ncbi:Invasion protein IalB, involved in pathogenesis [Jannaschia helgolandensis]|uniref:Invasion protein IalB, involved in pathogenesis n=2 Tax=Jannaschia helgolandensis TaxID=188906 RepID=A0A1H7T439_9RHOB|nr:Invasion protein IalB, involved in pathogenesis [Jannaschia helgolandensis]